MSILSLVKGATRNAFNRVGLDLLRVKNSPGQTLLGLRNRPFRTIIDVGANTGQFARHILGFFPSAHLYCFEPLPGAFAVLSDWARTQAGRVEVFNRAVGDSEGQMEMNFHSDHSPSSSLLASTELNGSLYPFTARQQRMTIEITTLDAALGNILANLPRDILVKMDVQGYEDRVISGGEAVLSAAFACILEVCLDGLYERQANFKELLLMLDRLGFRYAGNLQQTYGDDGRVIYLDAVFLK